MIPGDIGAEIARVLRAGTASGEWPGGAADVSAAGTWRPAPAAISTGPGSYSTSLPLALGRLAERPAAVMAAALAASLAGVPWISAARVTGDGYLTISVTQDHLAALAARIVAAGQAAASSDALAGRRLTAPGRTDPAASATWERAWQAQRDALTGLLARAAGTQVLFIDPQLDERPSSTTRAGPGTARVSARNPAEAVASYGAEAVGYALARTSAPRAEPIERQLALPVDLDNPFVAVRYAHADAASTLRWAADLGLARGPRPDPGASSPAELRPPELTLLDAMSWLQERVAAAARRRRPAELAAYLEYLAAAWLDCRESCPALPFQGRAAPDGAAAPRVCARLGLAEAARVTLACGLSLLGVRPPDRM
jgi:arginyl-tRNA synthetase